MNKTVTQRQAFLEVYCNRGTIIDSLAQLMQKEGQK